MNQKYYNTKGSKFDIIDNAVVKSLRELKAFGTSKKDARGIYNEFIREEARKAGMPEEQIANLPREESPFIHGISTFDQYVAICKKYMEWVVENNADVHSIKYAYKTGCAKKYIQHLIDKGYAPSTINRATAALAKLHRVHACDIHDDRPVRRYKDFTRSRNYNESHYEKDVEKYGDIAELCRCTGVREVELEHLKPECFQKHANGDIYLHLDGRDQWTKGGKTRDVTIIPENQERLADILSKLEPEQLICPQAPSHLDIHGIRAMYAMDYYNNIARDIDNIPKTERVPLKREKKDNSRPKQHRIDAPAVYRRRSDGKKFDRTALLTVSESLGHSRVDVMIASYLR